MHIQHTYVLKFGFEPITTWLGDGSLSGMFYILTSDNYSGLPSKKNVTSSHTNSIALPSTLISCTHDICSSSKGNEVENIPVRHIKY